MCGAVWRASITPFLVGVFIVTSSGKLLRAGFLYQYSTPIVISPIDDFLIFGPKGGLEAPSEFLQRIADARPDAILTHAGLIDRHPNLFAKTATIINLSASITRSEHSVKLPLHGLETALRLHANAVAYHINVLSSRCSQMMDNAAELVERANRYDVPVLGIIYPRNDSTEGDGEILRKKSESPIEFADLVSHCVSIGASLGFDAIKTWFTDDQTTFRSAVLASGGVPLLIAGGPKVASHEALARARLSLEAGAAGVSFGRNLFGRTNPSAFIAEIRNLERQNLKG